MSIDGFTIRDRVRSVCASDPFFFTEAVTPFSFELQPSGQIDQVFRIEVTGGEVIGGFNYTEDRTDELAIWVARKYAGHPDAAYRQLQVDITSIRAAVIRDGAETSGEYIVPNGNAFELQREVGKEFCVVKLALPINYEAEL